MSSWWNVKFKYASISFYVHFYINTFCKSSHLHFCYLENLCHKCVTSHTSVSLCVQKLLRKHQAARLLRNPPLHPHLRRPTRLHLSHTLCLNYYFIFTFFILAKLNRFMQSFILIFSQKNLNFFYGNLVAKKSPFCSFLHQPLSAVPCIYCKSHFAGVVKFCIFFNF